MLKRIITVATALTLLGPGVAFAQTDGWKTSGSIRLRQEFLNGQVRTGFNASESVTSLRTILSAEYTRGSFRAGGELYDSRVYGADAGSPVSGNDVNTLEPVQLYVGVKGDGGVLGPVSAQVGRMALNLGSRRLVAADDYRNTTNGYEGVRVDLAPYGVKTTLIYTRPVVRLPDSLTDILNNKAALDEAGSDLQFWGAIAARPKTIGGATLEGSWYHLEEKDAPGRATRDRSLDSFGARLTLDPKAGHWDYEVEVIRQTGAIRASAAPAAAVLNVEAGLLHARAGYSWNHKAAPRLSGFIDVVTGDDSGPDYGRFDGLFGTRRSEFGPSGMYAAIGRANIISPGLRLEVTPSRTWDAFVVLRGLWLEAEEDSFSTTGVRDAAGASGRFAGTQVEGRARYWLVKDRLRGEVNWAWLKKGQFLRNAPNAPATGANEQYVSLNLTAQF